MYYNGELPNSFNFEDKSTYFLLQEKMSRIQKMTINGCVTTYCHHSLSSVSREIVAGKENLQSTFTPNSMSGTKLKIDHAGFLELSND